MSIPVADGPTILVARDTSVAAAASNQDKWANLPVPARACAWSHVVVADQQYPPLPMSSVRSIPWVWMKMIFVSFDAVTACFTFHLF